jgi:hypothetical protein
MFWPVAALVVAAAMLAALVALLLTGPVDVLLALALFIGGVGLGGSVIGMLLMSPDHS